jgi:hypothetical protein
VAAHSAAIPSMQQADSARVASGRKKTMLMKKEEI